MDYTPVEAKTDFYKLDYVPLEDSLKGEVDRISKWRTLQSGVDARSGNIEMRDRTNQRLVIGQVIKDVWAVVITKDGYNVREEVSV